MTEHRTQTFRRQINESFCSPDGQVAITKVIAVFAQIVVLFNLGRYFDVLTDKPEALGIVLTILVAPDLFKKVIAMKYGNGTPAAKT